MPLMLEWRIVHWLGQRKRPHLSIKIISKLHPQWPLRTLRSSLINHFPFITLDQSPSHQQLCPNFTFTFHRNWISMKINICLIIQWIRYLLQVAACKSAACTVWSMVQWLFQPPQTTHTFIVNFTSSSTFALTIPFKHWLQTTHTHNLINQFYGFEQIHFIHLFFIMWISTTEILIQWHRMYQMK